MAKKKRGKKKKGKKKGKTGKKTSAKVAPYYPVVLTPNYKFGNIISKQIEDNRRNNSKLIIARILSNEERGLYVKR